MRMRPLVPALALVLLLPTAALGGEEAAGRGKATQKPAEKGKVTPQAKDTWRPSKEDLASWYKPVHLHGIPFYDRVGAARWQGQRRAAKDGRARLLLELRILGALDGAT